MGLSQTVISKDSGGNNMNKQVFAHSDETVIAVG